MNAATLALTASADPRNVSTDADPRPPDAARSPYKYRPFGCSPVVQVRPFPRVIRALRLAFDLQPAGTMELRPRVVVACPDPVECERLTDWLSAEHEPVAARQLQAAVRQVQAPRPNLIVADARLAFDEAFLSAWRCGGPVTPLVVVGDESSAAEAAARRHGAFYVVRPVERDLLLCSVAMALVDARPTRRSPRFAIAPLDATANGVAASVVDVANEGLRLEFPSGRQSALPPFFSVNVPLIGLSLVVQRVWTSTTGRLPGASVWCGGALADNAPRQVQRWRNFVEMVPRSR